jgi:hypothetical protein
MTKDEKLQAMRELLDQIPGVCVTWWAVYPGQIKLVLYIESKQSVVLIAASCSASNMTLKVEQTGAYSQMAGPPAQDELNYVLDVKDEDVPMLGLMLVTKLLQSKMISSRRARAWRTLWGDLEKEQAE